MRLTADEPRAHASAECAYVVSGQLIAQVAGVDYTVLTGESISFDSRLPHRYRNDSQESVEFILAGSPPNV